MFYHPRDLSHLCKDVPGVHEYTRSTTLRRIVDEGLTTGNFALLDEFIAKDYLVHCPFGDLGLEAVKGFFGALRGAFTNFKVVRAHVLVEENFAATRSVVTGIFDHEFPGPTGIIKPNGQPIELQIINIFRFGEDGLIVEEWAQFDNLGFLTQLGAMTASTQ